MHRFVRETAYRFLPPVFFPPLAVFFAIVAYPPFRRGIITAREPPALQRRGPRRAGLRCQSLVLAAVSIAPPTRARIANECCSRLVKKGVSVMTPPDR